MTEEEKDSIEILENTDLDINTIDSVDLHTYNYAVKTALNLIQKQQKEIEKKDKMIDERQKEIRDHIGFENRLKRENKEPDLFNQGRFYVANNIKIILKGK